jgi:GNAT superfamily N-acetyltransferase
METFALYAGGSYGVIDEMYVDPAHRAGGVGRLLIDAVKDLARRKGWVRVDVTAPPGERWRRTVRFYEKQGFVFTGPKLRFKLP